MLGARRPFSVDQLPGGGDFYPFVEPSDDVRYLIGDAYLAYQDQHCLLQPPFRIAWMYGFGDQAVSNPGGYPTPTHDLDVLIFDGDGDTVFDSTTADIFHQTAWGDTKEVLEWVTDTAVLRVTRYLEWPDDMDPILYPTYLLPEDGRLVERAYTRVGPRLRSLRVGATRYGEGRIQLVAGYNIKLDVKEAKAVDGGRRTTQIIVSANPGDGTGRFPRCEDDTPLLRKINDIGPDDGGNFQLSAINCLRLQRPVDITSFSPREATLASDSLTDEEAAAALILANDCGPCCTCDDFIASYESLRALVTAYQGLGSRGQTARDLHKDNVERWNDQKSCRESQPFKLVAFPECPCRVQYGLVYCNTTDECLSSLSLKLDFSLYDHGVPISSGTLPGEPICDQTFQDGSGFPHEELYSLGGTWPRYQARWNYLDPNGSARLRFRMNLGGDCVDGQALRLNATMRATRPNGWILTHHATVTVPLIPPLTPGGQDCAC